MATILAGLCVGCVPNLAQISSGKIGCPETEIAVSDESRGLGTSSWVAVCRGRSFRCSSVHSRFAAEVTCTAELTAAPGADTFADAVVAFAASHGPALRECAGQVQLTVQLDANGGVTALDPWDGETPPARGCVANRLVTTRVIPPPQQATSITFDLSRADFLEEGSVPVRVDETAPTTSEPADPSSTTAQPAPATPPEISNAIDPLRADVLACSGTERIALRIEWSGTGATISVQGPLAGSPEEQCIRGVLAPRLVAPAEPASGTVVYLVH